MKYTFLLLFTIVCTYLPAQTMNFLFKGTITNHFTVKPEANSDVSIVQNGSKIASTKTDASGIYTLRGGVSIGSIFYVVFSKSGMVEKRIEFDFTKLNEEDVPAGTEYQPVKDLSSSIINDDPKYNVSFLKTEPVGKLTWNDKKMVVEINEAIRENMRKKIDAALKDTGPKQTDAAKYQAAIAAAQSFEKEQKYQQAISKYEEALTIRPTEKMPSDKIVELSALLAKSQKESAILDQGNQQYMNLIVAAKALADQKKYQQAIDKYNEALDIKEDQGVLDQVKTLKGLLTDAENEQKYKDAISSADLFYNQKSFKTAKDKYTIALKLKPNEQHPKTRLADIEKKLADLLGAQEKKKQFDDLVNEGDALFKEEKWAEAKAKYVESIKIESGATYSAEQVKECDVKLKEIADAQEKTANIQKWLKEGEDFFKLNKWLDAKQKYSQVIGLEPENAIAKAKMIEISAKIDEETKNAALNAQISKLITEGDALVKLQKLQEAKDKYSEALKLKSDPLVQQKIDTLDKQIKEIADKKAKEAEFLTLKSEGLKFATEQKWEEAKVKLTAAKEIKADPAIDVKLTEIETKLKTLANQAKLEADYSALLSEAGSKETANDLDGAIAKYKEALTKKPTGKEALDKIKELDAKKAALATAAQNEALFAKLVGEGDVAFDAKKNNDAKSKYEQALKLKNDPTLVSKLETVNAALQAEKAKEAEFLALKTEGLKLATEQKWEDAKTKLTAAKVIKTDSAIDTKLTEIETKIAALEGQAKIDSEYKVLLSEGAEKESLNDIDGALLKYKAALAKKQSGIEASKKITEIEGKKLAAITALNEQFNGLVKSGDAFVQQKKYLEAIEVYEKALKIKENDKIVVGKILEAQRLEQLNSSSQVKELLEKTIVAAQSHIDKDEYLKAKEILTRPFIKPEEDIRVKKMLQLIDDKINQLAAYDAKMNAAEKKVIDKDYPAAILLFEEAKLLNPKEKMPQKRIDELKLVLTKETSALEKDKEFVALISKGDEQKNAKKYNEALLTYKEALKIKQNDQLVLDKIKEVNQILDNEIALKKQEVLNKQALKTQLEKADKLFQTQKFEAAKEAYIAVQQKDPSNDYVNKQIELINENISLLQQKKTKQEFDQLVKEANELFVSKSYLQSKEKFDKAKSLQPSNVSVLSKLIEIDEILNPPLTSGELKPLGEIFDGSVLDGFAALQKAEEQRRFKSSSSIMDGVYASSKIRSTQSSDKDDEHYQTSKKIETINVNKGLFDSENSNEGDGKRAFLQDVQTVQLENKTSSLVYVSNDQIKLRDKINSLQQEGHQLTIDKMSSKQEEIYSLKELIDENSNRVFESSTTEANENVKDDKTIQGFVTENDQFIFEKETEKRKDDQTMQDIKIAAADNKNTINDQYQIKHDDEYQLLQSKQESIKSANLKVEQKDNNEAIETAKNVTKSIQEKDKKDTQKRDAKTELYDKIKSKQSDLASEKNEKTQKKSDEITNTNISLVDQKTKQQLEVNVNTSLQDEKTENLKSMMNAHHAASSDKSQKSNDKHYTNQATINSAEQTKTAKTISPNEIGKTYEEGVTEESFAQKDDKGLMKAFITRRVVVIEGRGVVYVRTQTVQATTFTKDGVSITESTWQKETQDPKLTKHKKN